MVAVHGPGRERAREGPGRAQEAIGILDAAVARALGQFGLDIIFAAARRQTEGLGQVEGLVEDGRGGEGLGC